MKISFVVPAYNEERNITECLESIHRQIGGDQQAEIIVVDNASTDGTASAAERVPGVRVVRETRKGIVWARARGLAEAKGDFVANIDADNRLPRGWMQTVRKEFEDPKLVCLSGPLVYEDLSRRAQFVTRFFYRVGLFFAWLVGFVKPAGIVQGGNFVFRKEAMEKAGGYDTSIEFYGEDTAVARKLLPHGKVKFTFRLPILSSGRRLKHEGVVLTGLRYALNFLWITFFGTPLNRTSRDIRET